LEVGGGTFVVNGRSVEEYFQYNENYLKQVKLPLVDSDLVTNFNVNVKVKGGGLTGQSSAISLSIARALIDYNSFNRTILKEKGLLTVDSRIKERKKYGLKKARKASQFSKR
jgi:small subunit ribosomal protein S9